MNARLLLLSLAILASLWTAAASPHFFVIAPDALRFNHDETVSVNIFGASKQNVVVWLEHNKKTFSRKEVIVDSEETPETVTIKVTEDDIFDKETSTRAKYVTLKANCMGVEKQFELLVTYISGYLIIQTDKPIYLVGQTVNYRVLALDEGLKHAKDTPIAIDIIDSQNRTVRRTKLTAKKKLYSDFYNIPTYADLRLWTIRAYYMGQFSTEARVTFLVEEYVLPTYGVTVAIEDHCLLPDTDEFEVEVIASYVYGKPVDGSVGLECYLCNDKIGSREYVMSMERRFLERGNKLFKINMTDIMDCPALFNEDFPQDFPPDDYYLEIVADVFETVTGHEEKGSSKVVFARVPYVYKFTQSRQSYRPGLVYSLQVQVLHANGKPLADGWADIKMIDTVTNKLKEEASQVEQGRVLASFETTQQANNSPLKFQVEVDGVISEDFIVNPYPGVDQVQIEMVIHQGKPQLRIFGNAQGAKSYTGMMMMIIARGTVIFSKYYDVSQELRENLDDDLLELLSPSARAVVFYVKKATNEIISDSVHFKIDPICRGGGLVMESEKEVYRPGSLGKLKLRGEPFMDVGLNAMDTALLLLNKDNIVKTNTMFRLLDQHDLGCGAGGGSSSSDVFKRSGLVVLTNANTNNVRRESLSCDGNARKKRATRAGCSGKVKNCCLNGINYGRKLLKEKRVHRKLGLGYDGMSKCYTRLKFLMDPDMHGRQFSGICLNQWIKNCLRTIEDDEEDYDITGKSLDDESDYEIDLRVLNNNDELSVRHNFKESWLFEDVTLDRAGNAEKELLLPDSITTWMIQGIGFSEEKGVCIAEPVDVIGFRDFFIQLDLPYSAVRLENVNIKATIFNYYANELDVHAYIAGVEGLCSSASVGSASPKQEAIIPGNSAVSFNFLTLPLKAGNYEVKIMALAKSEGVNQGDAVMKKLLVVNEGKEHVKTIHVCLDPANQMKECENSLEVYRVDRIQGEETIKVNLEIPENAVPGTGLAVGYIKSNIMTDVVEKVISGTESLLRMPTGCGEQTMLGLAPTVYAMAYVKQTKQVNDAIERDGTRFIRKGVEKELGYRHSNNSYAAWQTRPDSTWLSAFVMKVFCQAQKVVDDSVDTVLHVTPTLEWLLTVQNDGKFFDPYPVAHREMIGQLDEKDPSLTAFVIISFLECNGRTAAMNATVLEAVRYLEGIPMAIYVDNPYLLAIATYALSMADSAMKWDFIKLLKDTAQMDGEKMYWGNPGGQPASAAAVETTSYALLAFLNFHYNDDCAHIVRWLIQQREGKGSFRTTMDTVVGLQALSEYNIRTKLKDVNLQVSFLNGRKGKNDMKFNVTNENAQVVRVVEKLHSGDGNTDLTVRVTGTGGAYLDIDLTYNLHGDDEPCAFTMSDIHIEDITDEPAIDNVIVQGRGCDVCGKCEEDIDLDYDFDNVSALVEVEPKAFEGKGLFRRRRVANLTPKKFCMRFDISSEQESDMAIVSFGLETGVTVEKKDLDILMKNQPVIARYEMPESGKGYVTFYLDKISPVPVNFTFRLSDSPDADKATRQMATVDVYEYYKPDRVCTKFYGVEGQVGKPVPYECNPKTNRNCVCLQNICAKNFEQHYKKLLRRRGKPAYNLRERLCATDKADYAVLVEMNKPKYDPKTQYIEVTGEVKKVIHRGIEFLKVGSEMTFRYKAFCEYPNIKEGGRYHIIGKDGFKRPGTELYQYELMAPTVVIPRQMRGPLKKPMMAFEKMMKNAGCPT